MRVTDVKPTRLVAAQEAAKTFLRDLPKDIEVGLVTFAGSAQVVQPATLDRASLVAAIDAFQMQMRHGRRQRHRAVPGGAVSGPRHRPRRHDLRRRGRRRAAGTTRTKRAAEEITPVAPGSYDSAAIILLSDGRRTTGVDTLEAAKMAADRGVRIYVVGLGTVDGDGPGGDGMAIYLQLDEPTLREVARMTGGEYHHAGTAEKLRSVYQNLGSRLQVQTRETELAPLLALAGGDAGDRGGGAVGALVRAARLSAGRTGRRARPRRYFDVTAALASSLIASTISCFDEPFISSAAIASTIASGELGSLPAISLAIADLIRPGALLGGELGEVLLAGGHEGVAAQAHRLQRRVAHALSR